MTTGFTPSEHSEEVFTVIDIVDGSAYFTEPSSQTQIEVKTEQRTSISYLSWAISAIAIGIYGAYLAMPTESSFEAIYTRYLAKEEPRARVFEEGVKLRFDREAPPIAVLKRLCAISRGQQSSARRGCRSKQQN
ncbi:MAG: hypothetical protein IPJ84_02445 [Bdellovibrionales bacterium]|nr:hypothetical protein [Bdellovibrionales bacterium]